jgi:CrcB protein
MIRENVETTKNANVLETLFSGGTHETLSGLQTRRSNTKMYNVLWIALGGAFGTAARYWLSGVVAQAVGETFPWGTLLINVSGSFIIGFFAVLTGPDGRVFAPSLARQFVMTGMCGGFTTFSSFSLQTLNLVNDGEWLRAGGNIGLSVVLCLLAVWAGAMLANVINSIIWA